MVLYKETSLFIKSISLPSCQETGHVFLFSLCVITRSRQQNIRWYSQTSSMMLATVLVLTVLVVGSHQQCLTQNDAEHELVKEEALKQVAKGELSMSLDLFRQFADLNPSSNFIFSPYSIHQALILTYFGSERRTEAEIRKVLAIPNKQDKMDIYQAFRREILLRSSNTSDEYTLKSSNRIYVSNKLHLRPCMAKLFKNELARIDYTKIGANQEINSWVEENTEGQIKNLIPELSPASTSTIVNAAYFKGKWENSFSETSTKKGVFYISFDKETETDLMVQQTHFNYVLSEKLVAEILEMPYRGGDVSMFVFLPHRLNSSNPVNDIIQKLSVENFEEFRATMTSEEVHLEFPKFVGETKIELNGVLANLGLSTTLTPEADFSGFTGRREMFVDEVIHQAKVEVNEEGTRAYAATAFGMAAMAAMPREVTDFICNRAFAYVIYNKKSQNILFMGAYRSP